MKFDFKNSKGEVLSGRLDEPKFKPKMFALFAHCFSCSKDFTASAEVSRILASKGIATLRFDFTGLGNSQGDFSNTNFSSNVDDLISACKALGEIYEAPQLLVGHSLGGAAVLRAAAELPDVKAVATIGAPSDVGHVLHLFEDNIEEIESQGEAEVDLAGRKFKIKKQFVDNAKGTTVLDGVSEFKKALLVLHSPVDNTVSVDHAAKIFMSAKHPKSFVTLDNADHLLLDRADARYAGHVIASWIERYIPELAENEGEKLKKGVVEVKSRKGHKFTQDIYTKDNSLVADEPKSFKGDNLGMNPYELLLSGLGACTAMTMKMYADRKELPLEEVDVKLIHKKVDGVDEIYKKIEVTGDLTEEQVAKLHEIAEKCPVNKTLSAGVTPQIADDI